MKSNWLRYGLMVVGGILFAILVFGAGVYVGRTTRPGERVSVRFAGTGIFGSAHGASGTIQSIGDQQITVRTRDASTQTLLVDSQTRIERGRQIVSFSNLKVGDRVLAFGTPDATGQIRAKWIRVQERPPSAMSLDSSVGASK